jgi:hypothetical protein
VEAAVLLPALMLVLALLLEPACLLYTRAVMLSAASETARAILTDYDGELEDCREFALRRLAAVPEVPLLHVGGRADWEVSPSLDGGRASVQIRGHARPLPLMGAMGALAGMCDGEGVVLSVRVEEDLRPGWLGGTYEEWQEMWG